MSIATGITGQHPLSDIMLKGNQDIQMLQNDIAGAAGFKGMLEGREVYWKPDMNSLLQDFAEESGLMFGEKLAGRLKRKQDRQTFERVRNKAFYYIELVPDLGPTPRKLRSFLDDVRNLAHPSNKGTQATGQDTALDVQRTTAIMELAEKHFPSASLDASIDASIHETTDRHGSRPLDSGRRALVDPTLQYAALAFARDVMQDEEGPGGRMIAGNLQAGMDQLMEDHAEAIRAGMNVSATAKDYSHKTKGEIADLRRFYQEIILPYEDLDKVYQTIAKRIKEISFHDAVDYLISAAGKDIGSASPSTSPALLQSALGDIMRLQNLTSIYEASSLLLQALRQRFEIAAEAKPESFFSRTLEFFTQRWTAKNILGRMYTHLGLEQFPPLHFFLTNFMQIVKTAHDRCFAKTNDREIFINAIQDELDELVAQKESLSLIEPI